MNPWFRNVDRNHAETIAVSRDRNHPKPNRNHHFGFGPKPLQHNSNRLNYRKTETIRNHRTVPRSKPRNRVSIDTVEGFGSDRGQFRHRGTLTITEEKDIPKMPCRASLRS